MSEERSFQTLITTLEAALARPLPGAEAHAYMAPRPRREWPAGSNAAQIRDAAGLLLLFPIDARAHVVLTVRADHLGRHGGQVSLPGGVIEPGETFEQAALREAHEEIALPLAGVSVIGQLTPLDIPVSGFRLHPVVAARNTRPVLVPSDGEVARILSIAVDHLADPAHRTSVRRVRDGHTIDAPAFRIGSDEIWGATAMVLAEFLALLGWSPPRST